MNKSGEGLSMRGLIPGGDGRGGGGGGGQLGLAK